MRFHVFGEMVGTRETFSALLARETFFTGVRSQVTLKFIGTRERFVAEQPVAHERTQTGVPAKMSFEVARLAVYFAASCDMAHVLFWFVWFRLLSGDTVRTLATTAATRDADLL